MNKEKTVELFSFTSSNGIYVFILEENITRDLEKQGLQVVSTENDNPAASCSFFTARLAQFSRLDKFAQSEQACQTCAIWMDF